MNAYKINDECEKIIRAVDEWLWTDYGQGYRYAAIGQHQEDRDLADIDLIIELAKVGFKREEYQDNKDDEEENEWWNDCEKDFNNHMNEYLKV